jgi:LacI family transcriptional regulator
LFCFSDRVAMGAYQAASVLGLRIPEDLSVVGTDNLELIAAALWPGLTTVALPHYEMGRWAVTRLLDDIEAPGAAPVQEKFSCPLIERGSVGPPPNYGPPPA